MTSILEEGAVKLLDWRQLTSPREDGPADLIAEWEADCVIGTYIIKNDCGEWWLHLADLFDTHQIGRSSDPDILRSIAQSDYARRILGELIPSTDIPAPLPGSGETERKRAVAIIHWVFSADGTKSERSMADEAINKINDSTFMPVHEEFRARIVHCEDCYSQGTVTTLDRYKSMMSSPCQNCGAPASALRWVYTSPANPAETQAVEVGDRLPVMSATAVEDELSGKLVWDCHEIDGRDGEQMPVVELAAETFAVGTTIQIFEPGRGEVS